MNETVQKCITVFQNLLVESTNRKLFNLSNQANMTGICSRNMRNLNSVVVQFFEMVPIRRIRWPNEEIDSGDLDVEAQRYMLSKTVNSDLCQQFPPSIQYQRSFVKKLLTTLENYGVEICDELYETYTGLLQHRDSEEDMLCYKTYTVLNRESTDLQIVGSLSLSKMHVLCDLIKYIMSEINHPPPLIHVEKLAVTCGDQDEDVKLTIQESVNMISFGTTGLSTWQAAQHLAEWAVQNKQLFNDRNVLELGCGLGLSGLTVCKQCRVNTYTFTDCHAQVLDLLAKNIQHNFSYHIHSQTHNEEITKNICELDIDKPRNQCSLKCDKTDCDAETTCDTSTRLDCDRISLKSADSDAEKTGITRTRLDCDGTSCKSADCDVSGANGNTSLLNDCVTVESDSVQELTSPEDKKVDCDVSKDCDKNLICNGDVTTGQWDGVKEYRVYQSSFCKCIQLAKLDWEDIDHKLVEQLAGTDVILAADVVYDTRIIPALVSVLKLVLGKGSRCTAYIASTIRNEDTRDQFLISLSNEGLKYEQVDPPTVQLFHYDRSVPIEIIHITAA